jgi:hypothetical protein
MTEIRAQQGAGWWPALVLWGTVIAVGALYLASVEHHRRAARMDDNAAAVGSAASTPSPVPVTPAVVVSDHSQTQPKAMTGAEVRVAKPLPVGEPEMSGRPGAVSVAPAAASAPSVAPMVAAPAPSMGAAGDAQTPAQVTPAEARAFAEAVTEASVETPIPAPPKASIPAAQSAQAPAGAATATPVVAERARILAEYEALQRAAQQDSAPYWGGRMPQRYGLPSYAPSPERSRQAPGYGPGSLGH